MFSMIEQWEGEEREKERKMMWERENARQTNYEVDRDEIESIAGRVPEGGLQWYWMLSYHTSIPSTIPQGKSRDTKSSLSINSIKIWFKANHPETQLSISLPVPVF